MNDGLTRRHWLVLTPWILGGCFSHFDVTPYRAVNVRLAVRRAALMPLVVTSGPGNHTSIESGPSWLTDAPRAQLTPAERASAEDVVLRGLAGALGWQIVPPGAVDRAMAGAQPMTVEAAVVGVAGRMQTQAVVLITLRNFLTRPAGLLNAEASGDMTIAVHAPDGQLAWSLSAHVVRGPAGSNAPPSLLHAMEQFGPELRT